MTVNKQKLILILGPTASGKTELSLKLAKKFRGYIISADSRQINKGMDIGTAKPKGRIKNYDLRIKDIPNKIYTINNIPHFMIDIIQPDKEFTLADWQQQVFKIIDNMYQLPAAPSTLDSGPRGSYQLPFIVGGTGLYISSIIDNYNLPRGKVNKATRDRLTKTSLKKLLSQLKKLDPDTYKSINKTNKRRVVRALEYILTNNESFYRNIKKSPCSYDILQIGINMNRDELYKRINKRVDLMIKKGLIKEVEKLALKYCDKGKDINLMGHPLIKEDYPPFHLRQSYGGQAIPLLVKGGSKGRVKKIDCSKIPALSGIGYRHIIQYLNGAIDKEQAIELIKRGTRRYAKRQITWFIRDKRINWITNHSQAEKLVKNFIKNKREA